MVEAVFAIFKALLRMYERGLSKTPVISYTSFMITYLCVYDMAGS